jgi:hypothetical protein
MDGILAHEGDGDDRLCVVFHMDVNDSKVGTLERHTRQASTVQVVV